MAVHWFQEIRWRLDAVDFLTPDDKPHKRKTQFLQSLKENWLGSRKQVPCFARRGNRDMLRQIQDSSQNTSYALPGIESRNQIMKCNQWTFLPDQALMICVHLNMWETAYLHSICLYLISIFRLVSSFLIRSETLEKKEDEISFQCWNN